MQTSRLSVDGFDVLLPPVLKAAFERASEAWTSPPLQRLPLPVAFRASGALQAWQTALGTLEGCTHVVPALSSPRMPVHDVVAMLGANGTFDPEFDANVDFFFVDDLVVAVKCDMQGSTMRMINLRLPDNWAREHGIAPAM